MKKLTLDEVKKIQLEILAYIDSFCKKIIFHISLIMVHFLEL